MYFDDSSLKSLDRFFWGKWRTWDRVDFAEFLANLNDAMSKVRRLARTVVQVLLCLRKLFTLFPTALKHMPLHPFSGSSNSFRLE